MILIINYLYLKEETIEDRPVILINNKKNNRAMILIKI
jgi:hypothetical protein